MLTCQHVLKVKLKLHLKWLKRRRAQPDRSQSFADQNVFSAMHFFQEPNFIFVDYSAWRVRLLVNGKCYNACLESCLTYNTICVLLVFVSNW